MTFCKITYLDEFINILLGLVWKSVCCAMFLSSLDSIVIHQGLLQVPIKTINICYLTLNVAEFSIAYEVLWKRFLAHKSQVLWTILMNKVTNNRNK